MVAQESHSLRVLANSNAFTNENCCWKKLWYSSKTLMYSQLSLSCSASHEEEVSCARCLPRFVVHERFGDGQASVSVNDGQLGMKCGFVAAKHSPFIHTTALLSSRLLKFFFRFIWSSDSLRFVSPDSETFLHIFRYKTSRIEIEYL